MNITIKKFLELGTNSNQNNILKRSVIVFNFYCFIIILIAIILSIVSYFFDRPYDSFTGICIALICLVPLRLSYVGHIISSRILLCFFVTIPILVTSVFNKMTYEVVQPPQFFEDRFIFLAAVILPLTLFRLHEKRWLILGLSFSLLSILLYDPLHSAFGMGYFDFDFESTEYYFSGNFYPLISYFFIVVGFLYIKIQQEGSEASLLKNKVEIESKNRKLTYQAKALEAQSEKLKATYDQLKELDEYKEATTAMIVHDFRKSVV